MSAKAMRGQGRDGSRVTLALGGSFSESVLGMAGTNAPSLVGLQNWASEHPVWPQLSRRWRCRQGSELVRSLKATVNCPMLRLVGCYLEGWAVGPWRLSHHSSSQPHRTHTQLLGSQEGDEGPREEVTWPRPPHSRSLFRGLHLSFLDPLSLGLTQGKWRPLRHVPVA